MRARWDVMDANKNIYLVLSRVKCVGTRVVLVISTDIYFGWVAGGWRAGKHTRFHYSGREGGGGGGGV